MPEIIPLNTWLMHRHSQNVFKVVKIHTLHLSIENLDGTYGNTNRYITENDIRNGTIIIDKEGEIR
jgi:hypothetical protein